MAKKKIIKQTAKKCCQDGCGGMLYCVGFIGAVIYYISTATGFWNGVLGVLKALVWPAFLVFELLKFLGA
jgi:hypothetical protein